MPIPPTIADQVRRLFATPPVLAILGAHPERYRAAWYVPDYLHGRGAVILPVNPGYAGEMLHGERCLPTLEAAAQHPAVRGKLDAVVVFRRAEALAGHLDSLRAVSPRMVWLQLGIRSDAFAEALVSDGIPVVQDRCLKVDHARVMGF